MPSQTPMTDSNCDLGNAMIKTETLRYNHKKGYSVNVPKKYNGI